MCAVAHSHRSRLSGWRGGTPRSFEERRSFPQKRPQRCLSVEGRGCFSGCRESSRCRESLRGTGYCSAARQRRPGRPGAQGPSGWGVVLSRVPWDPAARPLGLGDGLMLTALAKVGRRHVGPTHCPEKMVGTEPRVRPRPRGSCHPQGSLFTCEWSGTSSPLVNTHRCAVSTHRCMVSTHRCTGSTHRCAGGTHRCIVSTHRCAGSTHRCTVSTHRCAGGTHRCAVSTHRGMVSTHRGMVSTHSDEMLVTAMPRGCAARGWLSGG